MEGNLSQRLRRLTAAAKASGVVHRDDVAARDEVIREADAAGWKLAEIVAETGLSDSQIHRIVLRRAS
jgi:hypothetical protein